MIEQHGWKRRLAAALVGGVLLTGTVTGLAAPVELSLEESIALALKNNPAIKISEADRDKARWVVREAQAAKGPSLTINHTASRLQPAPSESHPNPVIKDNFDNKLSMSLPLYTGGKLEATVDQAKVGLKVADLGIAKSRQQLKLDATSAYFSLLQTRNLLKVSQDSVNDLAAHLKNVQAQYEVGTVAKSDVLRSEVELANAQQSLIKAQNSYDVAMASLNNVVGLPLDTDIKLKEELKYEKFARSMGDSIQYALTNRPDVAQADAGVDSAKASVKIARSGQLPTLAFSGSNDWNDSDFPGAKNSNWSLSLVASLNLFDTGLTHAKVKESQSGVAKATEQARQTRDSVALEVRQAYLGMKEAEKRIDTSSVAVTKAEEDFKIAQVRYNAGVGTNLDVIDAELALAQAKTNYIQALYDYNTGKAKVEKAMGLD